MKTEAVPKAMSPASAAAPVTAAPAAAPVAPTAPAADAAPKVAICGRFVLVAAKIGCANGAIGARISAAPRMIIFFCMESWEMVSPTILAT